MKVLHIVGWYPTEKYPLAVPFIKRHIEALSQHMESSVWHIQYEVGNDWEWSFTNWGADRTCLVRAPLLRHLACEWLSLLTILIFWLKAPKGTTFDILNLHVAYPNGCFPRVLRKLLKVKRVVITEHWSAYHFHFNSKSAGLERIKRIFRNDVGLICVSEALARDIRVFSGVSLEKLRIVDNIVDTNSFFHFGEGLAEEGRFLYVGRLDSPKRPDILLSVVEMLRKSGRQALLRIVGGGPKRVTLEKLVRSMGLVDSVVFVGELTSREIADELNRAHALLHCSDYETYGVVCAEAACCGTPVVASRVGGIPEVVQQDFSALVDDNSVEAWFQVVESNWNKLLTLDRGKVSQQNCLRFNSETVGAKYYLALTDPSTF